MTKTLEDVIGMKANKKIRKGVVKREGVILEVPEGEQVDYITCSNCEARHLYESETYVEFVGNLHAGEGGGLLGNPDWKEHGVPVGYYCVDKHCLSNRILENEHNVIDSNNNVYLREGNVLQIVRGVETEKGLLLSGSRCLVRKKKHNAVILAVISEHVLDTMLEVSVPRDTLRGWVKEGKVIPAPTERP